MSYCALQYTRVIYGYMCFAGFSIFFVLAGACLELAHYASCIELHVMLGCRSRHHLDTTLAFAGILLLQLLEKFDIAIDAISYLFILYNFAVWHNPLCYTLHLSLEPNHSRRSCQCRPVSSMIGVSHERAIHISCRWWVCWACLCGRRP